MRILYILPCSEADKGAMPFAKSQIEILTRDFSVKPDVFYFYNRTSISALVNIFFLLRKRAEIFKPDVVHIHYGTVTALISSLALSSYKKIITFHGSDLNKTPQDGFWRDQIGRFFSQCSIIFASQIICVSKSLKERMWFKKSKAMVLPTAPSIDIFKPLNQEECKKTVSLDQLKKYILFNANNPGVKRLDIALKVEEILKKKDATIQLLPIKGGIKYSDMPLYINSSACILLCSDSEGSPAIVKEAMACNVPVVSVKVGDVEDVLEGTLNSYIVEKEAHVLAEKIECIVFGQSKSNGREILIKKNLTEDLICKKLVELYQEVSSI
jgi:teichuronic acid biosynthesis glycosyltransferase TuaC